MIRYILIFFGLLVAQVLVFNQVQFSDYINPAFYILFILILPVNTPAWLRLISAFALGFLVDIFSQSPGQHLSSSVLIAFLQPYIVLAFQNTEIDTNKASNLSQLGFQWFISSSIILVLIHQMMFFLLEVFSFSNFLDTLMRIGLSSFATFTVIFLAQLMIYRKQQ
jgi:rod shape-determining protein MreD